MNLIERLQIAFPFSRREVELLIHTAPRRYKIHSIEKRNGRGLRMIAQPTAELKLVQRWLVSNYLQSLPVHSAATAYRPSLGIKDHAQLHASGKYLLKLDFEDFFPSIRGEDFRQHVARFSDVTLPDQTAMVRLLFRADVDAKRLILSIGAPSSPAVSNTVMYSFDLAVKEYCEQAGVRYSRYADDLAFSTNVPHILEAVKTRVVEICRTLEYPRLRLNEGKTVFTSKKHQRQLTGLILSNDGRASLGREKKRKIRATAHHFAQGVLSPEEVGKLRGLIAFAMSIDAEFVASINNMLGEQIFKELMRGNGEVAEG
ncbi:retron St85 family RNA-directed DNA polymerase [Variovorax sp. Root434]|uniref:retron St85 family RNA-directed DNA polymerase n=1 Tax=Variovorax sp. Root434 TaxID=1736536 RepID=UPI0009E9BEA1|nr:retron St85 family RNA-directed DNA polymerase [Variovorax sp. Root434]